MTNRYLPHLALAVTLALPVPALAGGSIAGPEDRPPPPEALATLPCAGWHETLPLGTVAAQPCYGAAPDAYYLPAAYALTAFRVAPSFRGGRPGIGPGSGAPSWPGGPAGPGPDQPGTPGAGPDEPAPVSPVPLPAAVWLMLAGLGGLSVVRRVRG